VRLDYLAEGSPDCPLIRLSDFSASEASVLASAITLLASGQAEAVAVHELPGVVAVDGCELILRRRNWEQAVLRTGPLSFECGFTLDTWDNMAGLVEPFAAGARGFQWLAGVPGEASLLLTSSGAW
jgi:hypothetical protein